MTKLKVLRNTTLFTNRDTAVAGLNSQLKTLTDGEFCSASYGDSWETSKTIMGIVRVSGEAKSVSIFDVDEIKSFFPCVTIKNFDSLKTLTTTSTSDEIVTALSVQDSSGEYYRASNPKECTTASDVIAAFSKASAVNGCIPSYSRSTLSPINIGYNGQNWVLSGIESIPRLVSGTIQPKQYIWNICFNESNGALSVATPLASYSLSDIQTTSSIAYSIANTANTTATSAKSVADSAATSISVHNAIYKDLGVYESESAAMTALASYDICSDEDISIAHYGYRADNSVYVSTLFQCLSWDTCRQIIYDRDKFKQRIIKFTSGDRTTIKTVYNWNAAFCDRLRWDTTSNKYIPVLFDMDTPSDNTSSIPLATTSNAGLMSTAQVTKLDSITDTINCGNY